MFSLKRSEAIQRFLHAFARPDMAKLYTPDMEVQVNVAQDNGTPVEGEFKGSKGTPFTDGLTTWAQFRMPEKPATEAKPNDWEMKYDISLHAEGIGLTGWNFTTRTSHFVKFDVDAIFGHSDKHKKKLTAEQIAVVVAKASLIDWVEIRESTGGKGGKHLGVFFDPPVATANHTEHAALARAVLDQMSALTGFDFSSNMDAVGGNTWIWHRKSKGTNGFELIKASVPLKHPPINWRDHLKVVQRKSHKATPGSVKDAAGFDKLAGENEAIPLDDAHKRLLEYLSQKGAPWTWSGDHRSLSTHTILLQEAHNDLKLKGVFRTNSPGTDRNGQNCFLFPMADGAWSVRRYSQGCAEDCSWTTDASGWTTCFLNREPDLESLGRAFSGVRTKNGFEFTYDNAVLVVKALGVDIQIPKRDNIQVLKHKGKIYLETSCDGRPPPGWTAKGSRIFAYLEIEDQTVPLSKTYDDQVRHIIDGGEDAGWVLRQTSGEWPLEPFYHIKPALRSLGAKLADIENIVGRCINNPWKLVNLPFQGEYPGNRTWNLNAPQLAFVPSPDKDKLNFPTWTTLFNHIGRGIDRSISKHEWCKKNGILTGGHYLKAWLASVIQKPSGALPYLFLYSKANNSGKSTFHEAISGLFTRGVVRAESALTNANNFNGELANSVIAVIEEINMAKNKVAYARIKDWTTSLQLPVHFKGKTPFSKTNNTHFIQCSNDKDACPIFPGDSRITMIKVNVPSKHIPKRDLIAQLMVEAPDFLAELLTIELPLSDDRLNLPAIATEEKKSAEESNRTAIEEFLDMHTHQVDGHMIDVRDFLKKFRAQLDPHTAEDWRDSKLASQLEDTYPIGKLRNGDGNSFIGNISWVPAEPKARLHRVEGFLE